MKKFLVLVSVLFVALACYGLSLPATPTFLGVQTLTQEALEEKIEDYTEVSFDANFSETVLFETANLVYEKTFDCYFISVGEGIRGDFVVPKEVKLFWIGEEVVDDYQTMIQQDETFTLAIFDEESYAVISVKLTTMPLIVMVVDNMPETLDDEPQMGYMTVITPYSEEESDELPEYTKDTYFFNINVRGQTSSAFIKKSYKINLVDATGARAEDSIFGMRKDNDWALNAIFSDKSRLRDLTCYDLYAQLAAEESTENMYPQEAVYCEVILNGEYYGFYLMAEHMDTKQLEVNEETDIVYKTVSPFMPYAYELASYLDGTYESYQRIEIKNDADGQLELAYSLLEEYLTVLPYYSMEPEYSLLPSSQGVSLAAVESVADLDNIIDLSIFKLCLDLWDNDAKNMMLSARLQEDGSYLFYKDYFDFNYSFGDIYLSDYSALFTQENAASEISLDYTVAFLLNGEDADEVIALYQARYAQLRETVFSEENILATLEENRVELDASGAYLREIEVWDYEVDIDYENERITSYVSERLALVDEFVANLGQEDAA